MSDLLDEPRLLGGQLDLQGVVVDRGHHDLVTERCAVRRTAVVFGGALDPAELVRVTGSELRVERALPRILEVCGRHRVAVGPRPVLTEMEGDQRALDVPRLCESRLGLERVRVELDDQVEQDVRRRRVLGDARVECRRIGPQATVMTCSAAGCSAVGRRSGVAACRVVIVVVATATGGSEREDCHERGNEQEPCLSSHFRPPLSFQSNGRTVCTPHGHWVLRRTSAPEVSATGGRDAPRWGCRRAWSYSLRR